MASNAERFGRRETGRLEAFSDGVFAFAITLLVLYLKDPATSGSGYLLQGLLNQWPTFFAFVTSFMTILIMWINHHEMFTYIVRVDKRFMFMNGILLFFVTLTPFTTSLVADHIFVADSGTDSEIAALVYAGSFLLLSAWWNLLSRHAVIGRRLIRSDVTEADIRAATRSNLVGPVLYSIAFVIALFSGIASVVVILAAAVFYAVGASTPSRS